MKVSDFINKWVCSDSFGMMKYQGRIVFQGLSCICYFPSVSGDEQKELVFAFNLPCIDEGTLFNQLQHLDNKLTETYGLEG